MRHSILMAHIIELFFYWFNANSIYSHFFFFANLNLSKIVFYARVCLRNTSLNGAAHMHWIIIFLVRTAIVIDDFFFWVKCWLVGWFHSSAFSRYVYTVVYENWLRRDGGTQMLLVQMNFTFILKRSFERCKRAKKIICKKFANHYFVCC